MEEVHPHRRHLYHPHRRHLYHPRCRHHTRDHPCHWHYRTIHVAGTIGPSTLPSAPQDHPQLPSRLGLARWSSSARAPSATSSKELCRSAHLRTMQVSKEVGVLLSFDPNLWLPLWPSPEAACEKIMSIWDQTDIIKINDVKLAFLSSKDSVEDVVALLLWRPSLKLLLVTPGKKGCEYYTKDFREVESYRVKQVDTTGVGDAFVGVMLQGIVRE